MKGSDYRHKVSQRDDALVGESLPLMIDLMATLKAKYGLKIVAVSLALDTSPKQILYIENTFMFIEVAESLGIRSIFHTDCKSTRAKLASFGLDIS